MIRPGQSSSGVGTRPWARRSPAHFCFATILQVIALVAGTGQWCSGQGIDNLQDRISALSEAIERDPQDVWALYVRGRTYLLLKDYRHAVEDLDRSLKIEPQSSFAMLFRSIAYESLKNYTNAARDAIAAVELDPDNPNSLNHGAWLLATCPEAQHRNGTLAVEYGLKACELTVEKNASFCDTLAAAYAETRDFAAAVRWQKKAMELVPENRAFVEDATTRLELYKSGKPFHSKD